MPSWRGGAALVAGLLLHGAALAAQPTAAEAYQDGVDAYRAQRYEEALHAFMAAQRRGMADPNLVLNLGLTCYRLGRFYEARDYLSRVRGDLRYTAIADYHLGLIDAQQGQREAAMDRFEAVQASATERGLRDLATAALRRLEDTPLEEEPVTAGVDRPDAVYYLRTVTGFDSNPELINDTVEQPAAGEGAGYAEVLGNLEHPLGASALGTTLFRAELQLRQHTGAEGFDQQGGELGLRQAWRQGAWRLGVGGFAGESWLAGESYQSNGGVMVDGRRALGANALALRYEAMNVGGDGVYTYLDGWRHRVNAELARSLGATRARAELELERNARRDLADGEQFSSYSPSRIGVGVALGTPQLRQFSAEWRARYRDSRFRDPDRFLDNGVLREERRADHLSATGVRLRYRSGQRWNWLFDYEFSRNVSSLAAFTYTRQVASFGIEWLR